MLLLTLINTTPFGTLITPGDVPNMLYMLTSMAILDHLQLSDC